MNIKQHFRHTTYYGECVRRTTASNGPRQDSSALFSTFDELANDSSVNLCSDNNTERTSLCFYDNVEIIFKTTQTALSSMPPLDFISICQDSFLIWGFLLKALYNYNGLVALNVYNFWFHFTRLVFVFWVCSLQLFRASCAWSEGYSASL